MGGKESLSKQAIYLSAGKSIGYGLSFTLPLILVRVFTESEYGLYKQIFLIHATFVPILQLGVTRSLFYFFRREPQKKEAIIAQTFLFLSFSSLLFFIGLNLFKTSIGGLFQGSEIEPFILPLSIFIFFTVGASFIETLLIVEERAKLASIVIVLSDALRVGIMIIAILVSKSILFLLYAVIIFSCIRYSFLIIYIYQRYGFPFKKITTKFLYTQFSFAFPLGFAGMISIIGRTFDKYLVSFFFTASTFAIYSVGCFQIPLVNILSTSVGNIVLPKMAEYQKEQKVKELIKLYYQAVRKLALVYLPVFLFFQIIAKEFIVTLFTDSYIDSVPIFMIGLFMLPLRIVISGNILEAYGKSKYIFKYTFIIVLFNLILMYIFIKNLGLIGAILAYITGSTVGTFILLFKTRQLLNLPFSKILPWKVLRDIFFVSLTSGVITYFLKNVFEFQGLITLIFCFLVYFAVYGLLAAKFLLKDDEIRAIYTYFAKAKSFLITTREN